MCWTRAYPFCISPRCERYGPPRVISYQYDQGTLTAIPGWVDSITHHRNGLGVSDQASERHDRHLDQRSGLDGAAEKDPLKWPDRPRPGHFALRRRGKHQVFRVEALRLRPGEPVDGGEPQTEEWHPHSKLPQSFLATHELRSEFQPSALSAQKLRPELKRISLTAHEIRRDLQPELLTTQEFRAELKRALLSAQEVRLKVQTSFRLPTHQFSEVLDSISIT